MPYTTDGLDQWLSLLDNRRSARVEILHNIDEVERVASFRRGAWKLVLGEFKNGAFDAYYGEDGTWNVQYVPYDYSGVVDSDTTKALNSLIRTSTPSEMSLLRDQATINCPWSNSSTCDPKPGT